MVTAMLHSCPDHYLQPTLGGKRGITYHPVDVAFAPGLRTGG